MMWSYYCTRPVPAFVLYSVHTRYRVLVQLCSFAKVATCTSVVEQDFSCSLLVQWYYSTILGYRSGFLGLAWTRVVATGQEAWEFSLSWWVIGEMHAMYPVETRRVGDGELEGAVVKGWCDMEGSIDRQWVFEEGAGWRMRECVEGGKE